MRHYGRNEVPASQPEFGINANIIKVRRLDLTAARDLDNLDLGGTTIWIPRASSGGAWIDVRVNDQLRDPLRFQLGMFVRGVPFSRLYVSSDAQAGEWIDVAIVRENTWDNIEVVNPSIQFAEIDLTPATVLDTAADVVIVAAAAAAVVKAPLATQRTAFIHSLVTNGQPVRIGDAAVGAARGMVLNPGETLVISTTEAIYGWTAAGANQTLTVTWTAD
jgi:hypothetical protein